jgi:hypothetical protein
LEFWAYGWTILELNEGFFFSFYKWEEESEKKNRFVRWHSNDVEGLLIAAMLIANKEAYTLIYRA